MSKNSNQTLYKQLKSWISNELNFKKGKKDERIKKGKKYARKSFGSRIK
jgi:hypothetical protein